MWLPVGDGRRAASTAISFVRDTPLDLAAAGPVFGSLLFLLWANLLVTGASNGVNLTDGLDGLATGACVMVFGAFTMIGLWQHNQSCAFVSGPSCYPVTGALDLAVVAAAAGGACFGFLWWNASPAQIIMGDTGSLGLGAALAGLAILTRTELLLGVLGGLFVIVTLSVVIQVASFRLQNEYGVECVFESVAIATVRWVRGTDRARLEEFTARQNANLAIDHAGELVLLAPTLVSLRLTEERWPDLRFSATREHSAG